jgi:urate oxidase
MADKEVEALDVDTRSASDKEMAALDGEKKPVEKAKATDAIPTDKIGDEFVPLADERWLADKLSFITDLAKLMNHSEDWIEKRRRQYKENAARSKRIMDEFVQLYVEAYNQEDDEEEEYDDDYDANYARVEELNTRLWNEHMASLSSLGLISEVKYGEEDDNKMPLA